MSAETYQVGAHFKALNEPVLKAPSKIVEKFFFHFESLSHPVLFIGLHIAVLDLGCIFPNPKLWFGTMWIWSDCTTFKIRIIGLGILLTFYKLENKVLLV